ncbi:MAG: phospho-N-acetylmuramoyl-pentapeptide-transferase [Kiritimatiellae bacterium]|nr:phospho-N-acetylmuramoyl-pentapeptide-transferase [Kiritimatiellia bacterium]
MLYFIAPYLERFWGPFRLLRSHALLLSAGTFLAAFAVLFLLPKLWRFSPHDHGKAILGPDGMKSAGKPTGTGLWVSLLVLPIVLLVMPLSGPVLGMVLCLYMAMAFGYLDDRAVEPWGQLKKGLLDAAVCIGVAVFLFSTLEGRMWVPFFAKGPLPGGAWMLPWWIYVPVAAFVLFLSMNTTNCSDGVDGLAGSLSLISLAALAVFLYTVTGYRPMANYLLVTHNYLAVRWAILLMTVAGGFAGYLWWNAEPSKALMGDAGSRFLGLLVGTGVMVTENPFLILAFAPVVLVNGGGGLVKILLLRALRKCGLEVRPPSMLEPEEEKRKNVIVKLLQSVRFPLHDQCKKNLKWSNSQVLVRFVLMQAFLMPLLFVLLVKIR